MCARSVRELRHTVRIYNTVADLNRILTNIYVHANLCVRERTSNKENGDPRALEIWKSDFINILKTAPDTIVSIYTDNGSSFILA